MVFEVREFFTPKPEFQAAGFGNREAAALVVGVAVVAASVVPDGVVVWMELLAQVWAGSRDVDEHERAGGGFDRAVRFREDGGGPAAGGEDHEVG